MNDKIDEHLLSSTRFFFLNIYIAFIIVVKILVVSILTVTYIPCGQDKWKVFRPIRLLSKNNTFCFKYQSNKLLKKYLN